MEKYSHLISETLSDIFGADFAGNVGFDFSRTEEKFGDFATNAAMVIFGAAKKDEKIHEKLDKLGLTNPRAVAEKIREKLLETGEFTEVEIAGPGFLNLRVSAQNLAKNLNENLAKNTEYAGQKVLTEFSDPNPFKVLHIGHLYSSIVGDAISRIIENAGGEVHRLNFGGDVGLHVAKNLYAISRNFEKEFGRKIDEKSAEEIAKKVGDDPNARANWMAERYVEGTNDYENDEFAKEEITKINTEVYHFHREDDHDSPLAKIYWMCREWSYAYFDDFYQRIGVKFEKYYPESTTADLGLETVLAQVPKVYEKSDKSDAIIFPGEKYGLHTRVFVNSNGLPTYEAKDVGLSLSKWRDYHFDRSFIITGNDIIEYMKVIIKSISLFAPEPASRTTHLTHGNVKLAGGVKMSSRKGNFLRAVDVLNLTEDLQEKESGSRNLDVALGAIRFAFLKNDIGPDVIFEPENSVSLVGNSGPYVQYAAVRVNKILRDNDFSSRNSSENSGDYDFLAEKNLLLKLAEYSGVVADATKNLAPHKIANFAYELARELNKYYEKTPVATENVPPEIRARRLEILAKISEVFANSLGILGIEIPEKM
jgi:arginyl-tRNA synthetase